MNDSQVKKIASLLEAQQTKSLLEINQTGERDPELKKQLPDIKYDAVNCEEFGKGQQEAYDVLFLNGVTAEITEDDFSEFLMQIMQKAGQSILILIPFYQAPDGSHTSMTEGIRYIHPVILKRFEFTYEILEDNEGQYQIYNLYKPFKQSLLPQDTISLGAKRNRPLRVVYLLPHLGLTGGMKYLLAHARKLHRKGHTVYLAFEGKGAETAIPAWSDLNVNQDISGTIMILPGEHYESIFKAKNIDVIIAGFFTQLERAVQSTIPVLYWEQGSESLFGEIQGGVLPDNSGTRQALHQIYHLPVYLAAVSPIVEEILSARYGRKSQLLYTGIDTMFYHPGNKPEREMPQILLVGAGALAFKGFQFLFTALQLLWNQGERFQVVWATQSAPQNPHVGFPLEMKIMLPQAELAELYRQSDIFISGSVFESFPMPPMEAMASGTAVIATDNGGIHVYAQPGENLLLIQQGNIKELCFAIQYLLHNPNICRLLAEKGRETALQFSMDNAVEKLEQILYGISENERKIANNPIQNLIETNQIQNFPCLQQMVVSGQGIEAVTSFLPQHRLVSRLDLLVKITEEKKILHIGCCDHLPLIRQKMKNKTWLHGLLSHSCKQVLGVDINQEAIAKLQKLGIHNIVYGDITQPGSKEIQSQHWDYALFAEVVEHIADPVGFLRKYIEYYGEYTKQYIITVPNAFGLPFISFALNNGQERVNPDHKYWFTPYTLWKILYEAGLDVENIIMCAYENSYHFLNSNKKAVLNNPLLQDTIVAVCRQRIPNS